MKILAFLLGGVLLASLTPAHAQQGNPDQGRLKSSMCAGCHGIPGWKMAYPTVYHVPKLGGQQPSYIVAALKAYKSGSRSQSTMIAIAASLSDQDMADLAAYYGGTGAPASASAK
jgi:cytochrome c553